MRITPEQRMAHVTAIEDLEFDGLVLTLDVSPMDPDAVTPWYDGSKPPKLVVETWLVMHGKTGEVIAEGVDEAEAWVDREPGRYDRLVERVKEYLDEKAAHWADQLEGRRR